MSLSRFVAGLVVALLALCYPRLAAAADFTLEWDAPTDGLTTGYVLFYGTTSHSYTQQVDVGGATTHIVRGLADGTIYYFAVRAYNASLDFSDFSEEVASTASVPVVTALALSSSLPSPQIVFTPVTWSATATGGVTPYEFQWALFHDDQWTVGAWTAASTWTWTPSTPDDDYYVRAAVRSAGSSSLTGELMQTMPFTVAALPAVLLTAQEAAPQQVGSTIHWSAAASGGMVPYQYRWWVFNGSNWTATTTWTSSSTWSWKPNSANDAYIVRVWVRRASSTTDAAETSTSVPFPIAKKCQGARCR